MQRNFNILSCCLIWYWHCLVLSLAVLCCHSEANELLCAGKVSWIRCWYYFWAGDSPSFLEGVFLYCKKALYSLFGSRNLPCLNDFLHGFNCCLHLIITLSIVWCGCLMEESPLADKCLEVFYTKLWAIMWLQYIWDSSPTKQPSQSSNTHVLTVMSLPMEIIVGQSVWQSTTTNSIFWHSNKSLP